MSQSLASCWTTRSYSTVVAVTLAVRPLVAWISFSIRAPSLIFSKIALLRWRAMPRALSATSITSREAPSRAISRPWRTTTPLKMVVLLLS